MRNQLATKTTLPGLVCFSSGAFEYKLDIPLEQQKLPEKVTPSSYPCFHIATITFRFFSSARQQGHALLAVNVSWNATATASFPFIDLRTEIRLIVNKLALVQR